MKQKIQFTLIIISAAIASLGTYPYAKGFSESLFTNHNFSLLIAGIFVPAAVSANIALGTYSLQNTLAQTQKINSSKSLVIIIISSIAALSTGFICYVGYRSRLPVLLNVIVSMMVVIVNAGIGFSAINNALNDLSKVANHLENKKKVVKKIRSRPLKLVLMTITIISALLVTLTAYLASTDGLTTLLNNLAISNNTAYKLIHPLAIIIWLPGAILFANGSSTTVSRIYDSISHKRLNMTYLTLFTALIAIASGGAYAQMALEFFNTCKCIPEFFKKIAEHYNFVFYFFMPIAFIISAVVNGYALDRLFKQTKKLPEEP